jgi:prepilin-type N-terminal cleavage/methylation domain-containing protein
MGLLACRRRLDQSRGFTLLETLIALAIFAGLFGVLYGGLSGNWRGVRRVQMDALALSLAQSQFALAGSGAALQDGQTWSGSEGGVSWTVAVEVYRESEPSQVRDAMGAYWIIFDARWRDGAAPQPKSMRMRTLKLGAAR